MLDSLVQTVEVPCSPDRAFRTFIGDMNGWWPVARFSVSAMAGTGVRRLAVEARAGGRIVELGADGGEHEWGLIRTFAPPATLEMDFHFVPPGEERTGVTLVAVRFAALAGARTRVTLAQSGWEALGERAAEIRAGYAAGWPMILGQAYAAACSGAAPTDAGLPAG